MRRTENKQRRRQNDLMVIERARGPTATPNSEQGEHKSTLLILFFFHSLFLFHFYNCISGKAHMEGPKTTENLPAAC